MSFDIKNQIGEIIIRSTSSASAADAAKIRAIIDNLKAVGTRVERGNNGAVTVTMRGEAVLTITERGSVIVR